MRTRIITVCLMAIAALAIMGTSASAAPSFQGYTGLIVIPTADAIQRDDYNLSAFTLDVEEGSDTTLYAANFGIAENFEVGFARLDPDDSAGETFINGKYGFFTETADRPAVAVGLIDLTDESDTTVYVVMSRSIQYKGKYAFGEFQSPRIHLGVGGGGLDGIFGGISATLGERLLLMVEHDSDDINFGARLAITDNIRAHAAFINGDDFGLGISYNYMK